MKTILFLLVIFSFLSIYQCANCVITSLNDTLTIAIPPQLMTPPEFTTMQLDCSQNGQCRYLAELSLGGIDADSRFLNVINRNPPGDLPLDQNFGIWKYDGLTFGEISRQQNVKEVTIAASVPSNGCQLNEIPIGGRCIPNPFSTVLSKLNRDRLIFGFLILALVLETIILFIVLGITKKFTEVYLLIRSKLLRLK